MHRRRALKGIDNKMGHFKVKRNLYLAKDRLFWFEITQAIEQNSKCYIKRKVKILKTAKLVIIKA